MDLQDYSLIQLERLVLAVFKDGKKPEEVGNVKPVKNLGEVHDLVSLFFINRKAETISALRVEQFYPINNEFGGVLKGEWELGGYNRDHDCYYSMGRYPIVRAQVPQRQTFVAQKRLSSEEVYIEDHIAELFKDR